jgi:hypothetical protein
MKRLLVGVAVALAFCVGLVAGSLAPSPPRPDAGAPVYVITVRHDPALPTATRGVGEEGPAATLTFRDQGRARDAASAAFEAAFNIAAEAEGLPHR